MSVDERAGLGVLEVRTHLPSPRARFSEALPDLRRRVGAGDCVARREGRRVACGEDDPVSVDLHCCVGSFKLDLPCSEGCVRQSSLGSHADRLIQKQIIADKIKHSINKNREM